MGATLKPLNRQAFVITGASGGAALVAAKLAAKLGATIISTARNEDASHTLVAEVEAGGGRAAYVVCDVGDEAAVAQVVEVKDDRFGGFDSCVNTAGIPMSGKLWDVRTDGWPRMMFDTVYRGTVYGSLAAARRYREHDRPGAIVHIGSFVGDKEPAIRSRTQSATMMLGTDAAATTLLRRLVAAAE